MHMKDFPNYKDRILILALWFIFFVTAVSFGLFLLAFQDIGTILTFAISAIGTIILSILIKKVSNGYFLKYYLNKKELNRLLEESLKKFPKADEEFIKEFKKRASFTYFTSGKLFYEKTLEDDKWLLSNEANLSGLKLLISLLDNSIVEKTGFNAFIDNAYKVAHNGELIVQTLDNQFFSGEIRYLFFMVFLLSDFNLEDNNISEEYSLKIKKIREELEQRYDKLLYDFEDEILKLKEKFDIKDKKEEVNNQFVN